MSRTESGIRRRVIVTKDSLTETPGPKLRTAAATRGSQGGDKATALEVRTCKDSARLR
jgi:hypothetical protein